MMQGSSGQGNQNGQKQGGLSWTQSPSANQNSSNNNQGGAKPISQVSSPLMPNKTAPAQNNNNNNAQKAASTPVKKNDAPKKSGSGRTAGIFISGVIVGLIIGWGWFSLGRDDGKVATTDTQNTSSTSETTTLPTTNTGSTGSTNTPTTGTQVTTAGAGALTVASSQQAGVQVAVSNISVSVPTWVVVLDSVNGKPGNALGAQMFFAGEKSGTIELLRSTVAGKSYFVAEFIDNGDHIYSKQTDTQVTTVTGAPLLVEFTAR